MILEDVWGAIVNVFENIFGFLGGILSSILGIFGL